MVAVILNSSSSYAFSDRVIISDNQIYFLLCVRVNIKSLVKRVNYYTTRVHHELVRRVNHYTIRVSLHY